MNAMVFTPRKGVRRAGLTLIELTVVLLILVALAGILVPLLTGYLEQAHGASGATNIGELVKQIELHRIRNYEYPNAMDSLLAQGGLAVYDRLDDELSGIILAPAALNADQVDQLARVGITTVYRHINSGTGTATDGVDLAGPVTIDATAAGTVARLDPVGLQDPKRFGPQIPTNGIYVAFGIGQGNTMVGRSMADAPVHFDDDRDGNSIDTYARFIAVFFIPANTAKPARLAGVLSPHGDGLLSHVNEYNANITSD